ncbi:MAG TPA: lysylphosphatidylglycerol synthase transmembrane domain-containing protein [Pyrinomonadaceae bacterium]|jgi:hypothetical protein
MGESDRAMIAESAQVPKPGARCAWSRAALGYVLAFVCLVWVFHDFDFADLLRRTASMNLYWVAAAVLCDVSSYACQGVRWRLLLRPLGQVTVLRSAQAIYAGLFVNEVLPMKLGEVVRALLVSRWMSVKLGSVAASILVERICDGVWLAAGVVLAMLFVPLPRKLVEAGDMFAVGILVTLILLALLTSAGRRLGLNSSTPAESDADLWQGMSAGGGEPRSSIGKSGLFKSLSVLVSRLSSDLRMIGRTRGAVWAFGLSPVMLLLQGLSFWMVMRAYGLRLSFMTGALVFLIVHLGSALPNAPANIGTYQFFTVLGLTLFGVDKTTAAGFSLVVFALLTVPLWAIGFWALGRSGLTLLAVSRVRPGM